MHIIAISIKERTEDVPDVQKVLTKYGNSIVSRLGLHDIGEKKKNLILIVYDGENIEKILEELNQIKRITVNTTEIR